MIHITSIENSPYYQMGKKKAIIQRLYINGHITIDEMWILLNDNQGVKYYPFGDMQQRDWKSNPPVEFNNLNSKKSKDGK